MITGDRLQLGHDPSRHAAYVGYWVQALKDDPREIYRASQDAQVMSDYLLDGRGRKGRSEGGSGCRAGAGSGPGKAADGPAPAGAARLAPALPPGRWKDRAVSAARGLARSALADRLRGMAFVIDRVDLLAYAAEDARVLDAAAGTLSVPLASAAAYYLRETVPGGAGEPLTLACWESGHDLVIEDGADLLPQLAAGAQIYASGRLQRRIIETEDRTLCQNEVVCRAAEVVVLRGPDGRRMPPPARRRATHIRAPVLLNPP